MATHQQLLTQLAALPDSTLQRLLNLSTFIVTPDEDQLVNVTYEQMVAKALQLADTYFPQWTDRSESDFGKFLVELLALFSEKDFWYINAFANEGFLLKASLYTNVYAQALPLGYKPATFISARCKVAVTFQAGAAITIYPGTLSFTVLGSSAVFSNVDTIVLPVSATLYTGVYTFAQGAYKSSTTLFNGDVVNINDLPIEIDSVTQAINGVTWTRVEDFDNGAGNKVFVVLPNEDGSIVIVYGDGNYGQRPSIEDTIVTTYRVGAGTGGNGITAGTALTVKTYPTARYVPTMQLLADTSGGMDAESIDQIRYNASTHFSIQESIINPSGCIKQLLTYPDIIKAAAQLWANTLYFYIVLADGTVAGNAYLGNVANRFSDKVVLPLQLAGTQTSYVPITRVICRVFALSGYDTASMQSNVEQYIIRYTDPLQDARYGQAFDPSELLLLLQENIPGLNNVIFDNINGVLPGATVSVGATQIMSALALVDLTVTVIPII